MAEFTVKHGLKTEYSDYPDGGWDDSDRYLIVTVRATTDEGAVKKAEAFWAARAEWEPGYRLVEVVNLDADPD